MADLLDHQLARLHRRRRLQRALDHVLPLVGLGLGAAALVVLVVRLAVPEAAWVCLPVLAAGLLLPALGLPRAFARRDDAALLHGHLDRACGGQGLVMALASQPTAARDGDWLARLRRPLEDLVLPAVRWRAGRGAAWAAGCLLVALVLPQQAQPPAAPTVAGGFFHQVEERLSGLEHAGMIPAQDSVQARSDLAQLREHATGQGMDQPTWEGLDRLRGRVDRSVATTNQRLAQALALSEASAEPSPGEPRVDDAGRLAQAVAELALQAPGLVPRLPPGAGAEELAELLAQAGAAGALSAEQQAAVRQLGLVRAQAGRPLDPTQRRQLGEHLAQELAKARAALEASGERQDGFDETLRRERRRGPGSGAPQRGPGHAALTWGDPLRTAGGGVEGLPAGARLNPDGSVTLAEQVRDAEIDDAVRAAAVRAAARAFDPTAADARRANVAPRHRAVVERYFAAE